MKTLLNFRRNCAVSIVALAISSGAASASQITVIRDDPQALIFEVHWDYLHPFIGTETQTVSSGFIKVDFTTNSFLLTTSVTIDGVSALDDVLVAAPTDETEQWLRLSQRTMHLDDLEPYGIYSTSSLVHVIYGNACTPRKAKATAQLVNGFVVGATITDGGCGYTNPPAVLIQGGGGSGAIATAIVSKGQVVAIQILNAGFSYETPPQIVIGSPPFVATLSIAVSRIKITQNVVLGWKYVLDASPDPVHFAPIGPAFVADSESIVTELDVDTVGRFFRLRVVP